MERAGNFLSTIEEEWGTLMFFCEVCKGRNRDYKEIAIFGSVRGRRGAMSAGRRPDATRASFHRDAAAAMILG